MSDHPFSNNVLKFTRNNHKPRNDNRRSEQDEESVEIVELQLPEPDRISATDLLAALSRSPSPDFEKAVVFLARTTQCPCGCGEDTEEIEVFYGGGEVTRERLNWIADKIKLYAVQGID